MNDGMSIITLLASFQDGERLISSIFSRDDGQHFIAQYQMAAASMLAFADFRHY